MAISQTTPFTQDEIDTLSIQLSEVFTQNFPPTLLKSHDSFNPSWLLWKPTPNPDKTKILKTPILGKNWQGSLQEYDQVQDTYRTRQANDLLTGYGLAYTKDHPYVCVDIDAFTPDNLELTRQLKSYTELSPSHNGYHIIVALPSIEDKLSLIETFGNGKRDKKGERDLFISTGYVTLTGKIIRNLEDHHPVQDLVLQDDPTIPSDIRTMSLLELQVLLEHYFKTRPTLTQVPPTGTQVDHAPTIKQGLKPLSSAQVKPLLDEIPVSALTDDIFVRLSDPASSAKLDLDETAEAREPWLTIGMALHSNFRGNMDGHMLWREWSAKGSKFDNDALTACWEGFGESESSVTIATLIALAAAQAPQWTDKTAKGAVLRTIGNFMAYLDYSGVTVSTHELTKEPRFSMPDARLRRWHLEDTSSASPDAIYQLMQSDMTRLGVSSKEYPLGTIKNFLQPIAARNMYNPVREYFETSLPEWDGHDYVEDLLNTITPQQGMPETPQYQRAYKVFLAKWLLQVVYAACYDPDKLDEELSLNQVLVFQGDQGIGKTRWVSSLFPKELRPYVAANKDLKMSKFKSDEGKLALEFSQMLVCNINEIDKILSKPNLSSDFKAMLDKSRDKVVLPYGANTTDIIRRTVFIGSTNATNFLSDHTGNRRVLLMAAESLNFQHNIPLDQLWAQVYGEYQDNEPFWIDENTEPDATRAREHMSTHSALLTDESFTDLLDHHFQTSSPYSMRSKMELSSILTLLSLKQANGNSYTTRNRKIALHTWLKQITPPTEEIQTTSKSARARVYYYMPPLRTAEDTFPTEAFDAAIQADTSQLDQENADLRAQLKELQETLAKLTNSQ